MRYHEVRVLYDKTLKTLDRHVSNLDNKIISDWIRRNSLPTFFPNLISIHCFKIILRNFLHLNLKTAEICDWIEELTSLALGDSHYLEHIETSLMCHPVNCMTLPL